MNGDTTNRNKGEFRAVLSKQKVLDRVNELKSLQSGRLGKYHRNYRRYFQTPFVGLSQRDPAAVGFIPDNQTATTDDIPAINVIKSCIDSVCSKMATAKVRPFFNTMKGSFRDIQICKQLQIFFDLYFDEQHVSDKVNLAFRDACIFDTGYVYVHPKTKEISRVAPWNVYIRPSDANKRNIMRAYIESTDLSVDQLPDYIYEKLSKAKKDEAGYVKLGEYWDIFDNTYAVCVDDMFVYSEKWTANTIPILPIYYTDPVVGNSAMGIADMLNGIQAEINQLMQKITDASRLNPANTYFVPKGSDIKVAALNNRVGNVVQYTPIAGLTNPITVATPAFIDKQYQDMVDALVEKAYNMVGISELSSMGKQPSYEQSGIAIATIEDVSSDRYEIQLQHVIQLYVSIAKACILLFDEGESLMESSRYNLSLKWSDVVGEYDRMKISFSAAESLSKQPDKKLQELQQLAQAGIIPVARIGQLLELPDIQTGYSLANNAENCVLSIIDRCINDDNYDIPEFVPFDLLKEEIVNTELSLLAAQGDGDGNEEDIEKMRKLYAAVEDMENELDIEGNVGMVDSAEAYEDMGGTEEPGITDVADADMLAEEQTPQNIAAMGQAQAQQAPTAPESVDMQQEGPTPYQNTWHGGNGNLHNGS